MWTSEKKENHGIFTLIFALQMCNNYQMPFFSFFFFLLFLRQYNFVFRIFIWFFIWHDTYNVLYIVIFDTLQSWSKILISNQKEKWYLRDDSYQVMPSFTKNWNCPGILWFNSNTVFKLSINLIHFSNYYTHSDLSSGIGE